MVTVALSGADAPLPAGKDGSKSVAFVLQAGYIESSAQWHRFEVHALYPGMEYFRPSQRARWFERKLFGGWGVPKAAVMHIRIALRNHDGPSLADLMWAEVPDRVRRGELRLAAVPWGTQGDPVEAYYRNFHTTPGYTSNDVILLRSTDGRRVFVECAFPRNCVANTTFSNSVDVEFTVNVGRKSELRRVDAAINKLLTSWYQSGSTGGPTQ